LRPWRDGDTIGMGEAYLPDTKTKRAYSNACKSLMIESAARHILAMRDLNKRRMAIEAYPETMKEQLKAEITRLWDNQRKK
tara:strand:- start:37 stop:279 length:243 start_codon:yes stop_codon:yes gene_type:complete